MKKYSLIAVISILLFASGLLLALSVEKSNELAIVSISLSALGVLGFFTSITLWAFTKDCKEIKLEQDEVLGADE